MPSLPSASLLTLAANHTAAHSIHCLGLAPFTPGRYSEFIPSGPITMPAHPSAVTNSVLTRRVSLPGCAWAYMQTKARALMVMGVFVSGATLLGVLQYFIIQTVRDDVDDRRIAREADHVGRALTRA